MFLNKHPQKSKFIVNSEGEPILMSIFHFINSLSTPFPNTERRKRGAVPNPLKWVKHFLQFLYFGRMTFNRVNHQINLNKPWIKAPLNTD